ncbi:MAG: TonB family protein [Pedosphaera sp.]|nr:TonB family protein [Pedosphaera sp.]
MHSLLVLVLFVAPAFFLSEIRQKDLPTLDLIPSKAVDDLMFGGGSPKPAATPAPQTEMALPPPLSAKVEPQPPPEPAPLKPPPKAAKPVKTVEPEPTPPQPKKILPDPTSTQLKKKPKETPPKADQPDTTAKEKPKKPSIQPSLKKESESSDKEKQAAKAQAKAQAEADAKAKDAQAKYLARLNNLQQKLGQNLSSGTDIAVPGPGGEAYANYTQIVKSIYQNEWTPSGDLADNSATVRVEVIIARDGNVVTARVTQKSGTPALDKSVQRVLDSIKFVAAFPLGATDHKRSFIIDFNLKAKRSSG